MNTSQAKVSGCIKSLLDEKQAAEYLTLSPGTLSVWRSTGRYALPFVKVGRMVRYRLSDLDAWLAARGRDSGATA
jgi:excisionase family DNA binding protein